MELLSGETIVWQNLRKLLFCLCCVIQYNRLPGDYAWYRRASLSDLHDITELLHMPDSINSP